MNGPVRNDTFHEEIPAVFLHPKDWKGAAVLWLSEQGALSRGDRIAHQSDHLVTLISDRVLAPLLLPDDVTQVHVL